jgi:predicted RNA-binding Zn ribbon-like protein
MRMAVSSQNPPHDLQLVLDFVNTIDLETQEDAVSFPEQLSQWLGERGLLAADAPPIGEGEHRAAIQLREALRQVMRAHTHGEPEPAAAAAVLERVAEAGQLSVGFDSGGGVKLMARDPGYPGALARLLIPVADAAADGSWDRAKACADDECEAAFYDRSRNRSGRWCDMSICGNRTKVRAYRSKQG